MTSKPSPPSFSGDVIDEAAARIQEALAVLDTICEGDLLGELPTSVEARERHQRAVCLLALLHRDLGDLGRRLQAGSLAVTVVARATGPRRTQPPSPASPDSEP